LLVNIRSKIFNLLANQILESWDPQPVARYPKADQKRLTVSYLELGKFLLLRRVVLPTKIEKRIGFGLGDVVFQPLPVEITEGEVEGI